MKNISLQRLIDSWSSKRIAVLGLGVSNRPLAVCCWSGAAGSPAATAPRVHLWIRKFWSWSGWA